MSCEKDKCPIPEQHIKATDVIPLYKKYCRECIYRPPPEGWKRNPKDQYRNYCMKCVLNHGGVRKRSEGYCAKSIGVASRDGCDGYSEKKNENN